MLATVTEHLRIRLLRAAGIECEISTLEELRRSEWSPEFEALMRNRLIVGTLRYGRLGTGKPQHDRIGAILDRAKNYRASGNREMLVDVANLALLEFVEGTHTRARFRSQDDGEHVKFT